MLPITNLPSDTIKVRRRIRNDQYAVAFVKTKTTVEKWMLAPDGDAALKLLINQGINARMPNDPKLSHADGQDGSAPNGGAK